MISKTILSILLISIYLAQNVWAKRPDGYFCGFEENKPRPLPPSGQLFDFVTEGLETLRAMYAAGGKALRKQLLEDLEALKSKPFEFYACDRNLKEFEEALNSSSYNTELLEYFLKTFKFYFEQDEASFDADDKYILDLMRKCNFDKIYREAQMYFDEFVEHFYKTYESLQEDLRQEGSLVSKRVMDWFVHFKTLKDYYQKVLAFREFESFYSYTFEVLSI